MTASKALYIRPAGRVQPGQTFTVSEVRAKELEQRGFATLSAASGQPGGTNAGGARDGLKSEDVPLNKAEPLPLNKTDEGPKRRRRTKAEDAE